VDLPSFRCSILTLRFQSVLGELESDLVIRLTDMATRVTDTGISRMDTTKHIRTMAITQAPRTTGTTGIGFTATTVIITTGVGTKLT
jgi:hypothetical protein